MSLVERIKFLAEKKGLNIKQIEVILGFSNGSIRRWNDNLPSSDKLYKLANYLNVTCEYLLTGKENNNFISAEDAEWLSLIHQLPAEIQLEFRGEIKGYLKRLKEETVAAEELRQAK